MFARLCLIGCGMMGGSLALALRRAALVDSVVGSSLYRVDAERARDMGVIDTVADTPEQAVRGCDLVLLAVPVAATQDVLQSIAAYLDDAALVMDIGSTKAGVVQAARVALGEQARQFVPAHPITGREVAGVHHADAQLYQGARVILTPDEGGAIPQGGAVVPVTDEYYLQRATALWQALGCRVTCMDAAAHDAAFAAVSHLPHLLAFAMMRATVQQPEGAQWLAMAGPGFRDATRIAASDPAMWRDILLANRREVLRQARHLRHAMEEFEATLATGDAAALQGLIAQASATRAACRFAPPR